MDQCTIAKKWKYWWNRYGDREAAGRKRDATEKALNVVWHAGTFERDRDVKKKLLEKSTAEGLRREMWYHWRQLRFLSEDLALICLHWNQSQILLKHPKLHLYKY